MSGPHRQHWPPLQRRPLLPSARNPPSPARIPPARPGKHREARGTRLQPRLQPRILALGRQPRRPARGARARLRAKTRTTLGTTAMPVARTPARQTPTASMLAPQQKTSPLERGLGRRTGSCRRRPSSRRRAAGTERLGQPGQGRRPARARSRSLAWARTWTPARKRPASAPRMGPTGRPAATTDRCRPLLTAPAGRASFRASRCPGYTTERRAAGPPGAAAADRAAEPAPGTSP